MKNIFNNKVFIIASIIIVLGFTGVFAETIFIDVEGITSSRGHTGITMNMTIITDAGQKWFMVYEDGLLVNTTELVPDLTEGLVSYYSFENGTDDDHGNNDGTNYGAINTSGIIGSAYDFDGTNDYIDTNNNTDIVIGPNANFTISAWLNSNSSLGASRAISPVSVTNGFEAVLGFDASGNWEARVGKAGIVSNGITGSAVTINSWTHLVAVFNGDEKSYKFFLNGISQGTQSYGSTIENANEETDGFAIGLQRYNSNSYTPFNGKIDEVGIWDRTLTADEISRLYNSGSGLEYSEL